MGLSNNPNVGNTGHWLIEGFIPPRFLDGKAVYLDTEIGGKMKFFLYILLSVPFLLKENSSGGRGGANWEGHVIQ